MWIKCSEQMPPFRTFCLIYAKGKNWVEPCVIVAEWWKGPDDSFAEGEWCNVGYDQNDWLGEGEVTHWMPMPPAPSDTDKDPMAEAKKLLDWAANALQPHGLRLYTGGSGDGWPNAEMLVRRKIINFLKENP